MKAAQFVLSTAALLLNGSAVLGEHSDIHDAARDSINHIDSETPYIRSYFYIRGHYVDIGSGDYAFQGQMYVERLIPVEGIAHDTPIILIHGQGQTGTNFLNKPDGGRGWASLFTQQGYEVYIIDQTSRGRSPWTPNTTHSSSIIPQFSVNTTQSYFTATKDYMIWPQAINHTQWPGTGRMGDPIFDAFYAAQVQFIANETYQQEIVQQAGAALLDKIGKPAILVGHSQGGPMPMLIADARPKLAKALVLLEPKGPPFQEVVFSKKLPTRAWGVCDIPITYSPPVRDPEVDLVKEPHSSSGPDLLDCLLQAENPKPRQLVNLADKPILLVTGEASYHAQYDHCTVQYLRQAGCSKLEHVELGKVGIHGNGHMLFMEKNSDDIQELLRKWISVLK